MIDYLEGESETDRLIDEWHKHMPPLTDEERQRILDRIHKGIEVLEKDVSEDNNAG